MQKELAAVVRRESEAEGHRRQVEEALSEARQRARLLAELGRAHAERRARLEEALAAAGLAEPAFLADRVRALAGWERSLDLFLAGLTDAVVLASGRRPARPRRRPGRRRRATVGAALVAPHPEGVEAMPLVEDRAVVLTLGEALGLDAELAAALPPAFLVEAAADAARLARAHPGVAFLSRGGVWSAGGTVHVGPTAAAPGLLERERDLAALEEAVPRLEGELAAAEERLAGLVEERADRAREANRLEGVVAAVRQELAVAEARREDAEGRHRRLAEEAAGLDDEARQSTATWSA